MCAQRHKLWHDHETFSEVDLPSVDASRYARHPSTEILMTAYALDDGPIKQWVPVEGELMPAELEDALLDERVIKMAWNKPFEYQIWKHVEGIEIPHDQWRDPMVLALSLSLPAKLEKACPIVGLSLEYQKQTNGKALMNWFSKLRPATKLLPERRVHWHEKLDKWNEYKEYNRQDVKAERAFWRRCKDYDLPPQEWALWAEDQEINEAGIPIDLEFARHADAVKDELIEARLERMAKLTGLANPNSRDQILPWLQERGYPYGDLVKGHVRRYAEKLAQEMALGGTAHWQHVLLEVLNLRLEVGQAAVKKYGALVSHTDDDGCLRHAHQFAGAGRTWRWSGRVFQPQNIVSPKGRLAEIEWADRPDGAKQVVGGPLIQCVEAVAEYDAFALDLLYEKPMDMLSASIRPTVRAPDGYLLIDADLKAIENVVLGWLAHDEKILGVFRDNRDPYVDFASYLYQKPYAELFAEYKAGDKRKRTVSKPGVLGCGYGLSAGYEYEDKRSGEIEATGLLGYARGMGIVLTPEQADLSVTVWRNTFKKAVEFWYAMEKAAMQCVRTRRETNVGYIGFDYKKPFLRMILPSKRPLHYCRPKIEDKMKPWGDTKPTLTYEGLDAKKQWTRIDTFYGKLVENCLAADTMVVTASGLKEIVDVRLQDRVWDGSRWVTHGGLVARGAQWTINFGGVRMTRDHRVEVEGKWVEAEATSYEEARASYERHHRTPFRHVDGSASRWVHERGQGALACALRLWHGKRDGRRGISAWAREVLRLLPRPVHLGEAQDARYVAAPHLLGLAFNGGPLYELKAPSVAQLRGPGHSSLRRVGRVICSILAGHGANVHTRADNRPEGQQRALREVELSMGDTESEFQKPQAEPRVQHAVGADYGGRGSGAVGHRRDDAFVPTGSGVAREHDVHPAGCYEQVFDLKNAGPNHRFAVVGADGRLFLVHNCDQATARDLLAHGIRNARREGIDVRMHVHDQIVGLAPEKRAGQYLQTLIECMTDIPAWAKGMPVMASGHVSKWFLKD